MDKSEAIALRNQNVTLTENYLEAKDLSHIWRHNVFTMRLAPPKDCDTEKIYMNICVNDKSIISSNLTGIYAAEGAEDEMLKALNFINSRIIVFGRFSINSRNEVVYDYAINLFNRTLTEADCDTIISISDTVLKRLVKPLSDIAKGRITADRFISDNS